MNRTAISFILAATMLSVLPFTSCKDDGGKEPYVPPVDTAVVVPPDTTAVIPPVDTANIDYSNIKNLYAMPLSIIQKAIEGKWQMLYAKGGIAANQIQYYDNHFVEFTADKYISIYATRQDTMSYTWLRDVSPYIRGDSVYIMGAWLSYVFEKIYNDTLKFGDYIYYLSDARTYYCIKNK